MREERPRLFVVDYFLSTAMHHLRFKVRPLYDFILHRTVVKQLNRLARFDELWQFDPNLFADFKQFKAKRKLLFLVDQYENNALRRMAKDADGIATISSTIMDYFGFSNKPKLLLNHGLNKTFAALARQCLAQGFENKVNHPVKVAYVGNLLQGNRMDLETIRQILAENANVEFHIYGPYLEGGNTLGSTVNDRLQAFIAFLERSENVYLHGILPQEKLAVEMQGMDAFLTCYNYLADYNKSSNCHKIIEYLSTGKVCISNRIITYEDTEGLLEMPTEYTNENLAALFKHVVNNLQHYNSPEWQEHRMRFALGNTYKKHVATITEFLEGSAAAKAPSVTQTV